MELTALQLVILAAAVVALIWAIWIAVSTAIRIAMVAVGLLLVVLLLSPEDPRVLAANGDDLINRKKAGPVKIAETTLKKAKKIFGRPSTNKIVRRGCIKVRRARWGGGLTIYFGKGPKGVATEVRVRHKEISSKTEGDLRIHTKKGLRVGNPTQKVKRLYPRADKYRVKGKTVWELKRNTLKGRLQAVTDKGKVDTLANAPYEYC
jgi:hypothetical protein